MQFSRLRESIMIAVNPQPKLRINCITGADKAIAIPSLPGFVILCKSLEAIWMVGGRLRAGITKQLLSIVDNAIAISV